MNENNLEYLKNTLKELGFGKKLNDVLENAIRNEMPLFTLGITSMNRPLTSSDRNAARTDHLSFNLNFNRSSKSDMYFLNNYEVTLKDLNTNLKTTQGFSLDRDYRITALQAHKLLSGLSFEKDVFLKPKQDSPSQANPSQEKSPVWFKLNKEITDAYGNHPLRTFRAEYGYNLDEMIAKYPIKNLDTAEKREEAIKTLRNGNYLPVQMTMDKKKVDVFIAANPQMKKFDVYDSNMEEIRDERIFPQPARNESQQNAKEPAKQQQQGNLPWQQEQTLDNEEKKTVKR